MDGGEITRIQLRIASKKLFNARLPSPERDTVAILTGLFHVPAHRAIIGDFELSRGDWQRFQKIVGKRATHKPIQYILGRCSFWKHEFQVTPDVLIPRPETEHLVETALEHLARGTAETLVDCCTGSGCVAISLALERPQSRIIGCDISPAALRVAEENRTRLHAQNCHFLATDMLRSMFAGSVDVITANPPYVASHEAPSLQPELSFEPQNALFSGSDGLSHIRSLLQQAPGILKKNGCLVFEFGYNQGDAIRNLVENMDSGAIHMFEIKKDLANHERIGLIQYA